MSATNIVPRGRRRRLVNGTLLAALAVASAVWMILTSAEPVWGALVFALTWLASLMLVQARERT